VYIPTLEEGTHMIRIKGAHGELTREVTIAPLPAKEATRVKIELDRE
jgi:hypothetical protein